MNVNTENWPSFREKGNWGKANGLHQNEELAHDKIVVKLILCLYNVYKNSVKYVSVMSDKFIPK